MSDSSRLNELIEGTLWIDTHEHLVEEAHRLADGPYEFFVPALEEDGSIPDDWTALLADYSICDLISGGMPVEAASSLLGSGLDPIEKWDLAEPYLEAARHTGYLRAFDISVEQLSGQRLSRETCSEVDQALRSIRTPGYYRDLLESKAGVERCHVHSVDADPFCESEYPDLLLQDLSLVPLILGRHARAEAEAQIEVETLDDYVAVIEACFRRYAPRAVAVKCNWAYRRPLEVRPPAEAPVDSYALLREGRATPEQRREVEDHLFDLSMRLAGEYELPLKLHLGTLDGNSRPQFLHVRDHVAAAAGLALRYPQVQLVLMHMAWPHQEELIAVAKHFPNVCVDLCWSWILAPVATRSFVARFLSTVPASKLLCFGGDYLVAENVVGHAALARAGLRGALEDLVDSGWLTPADALDLVPLLMRGNAERIFGAAA
jgi:predicted TIM-barrel fold metal-dependent hydrolase